MIDCGSQSSGVAMPHSELAALASQCYGRFWQSPLSREMNVNVRTVQRWVSNGIQKAATADNVRRFLTERRVVSMDPPPLSLAQGERDHACHNAMRAPLSTLAASAVSQGWHPAEVWSAMLTIATDEIYAMTGKTSTVETLRRAIENRADSPERQEQGGLTPRSLSARHS